jgi:mRNA-degrading endonuclease toxin of MazEF toxin-antitoxin module
VRAVDVGRLGSVIGSLPRSVVAQVDEALRLQLDLLDRR